MRKYLWIISLAGVVTAGAFGMNVNGWENSTIISASPRTDRRLLPNGSYGNAYQLAPSFDGLNPKFSVRYASERSPHSFAGATRVVLDCFDATDKNATTARLQLDNNEVSYSSFGDQRITVVYYASFPVKLTRLSEADPTFGNRCMFAIEIPREYALTLGENSLRLVSPMGLRSQPDGVRLLLTNRQGTVTDTLQLWAPGSESGAPRYSVLHELSAPR